MIEVITNHVPRNTIAGYELTERERAEFDYLNDAELAEPRFVRYKNVIHDLFDMPVAPAGDGFEHWDVAIADTFFSGIVARFPAMDTETVIMGMYFAKED